MMISRSFIKSDALLDLVTMRDVICSNISLLTISWYLNSRAKMAIARLATLLFALETSPLVLLLILLDAKKLPWLDTVSIKTKDSCVKLWITWSQPDADLSAISSKVELNLLESEIEYSSKMYLKFATRKQLLQINIYLWSNCIAGTFRYPWKQI